MGTQWGWGLRGHGPRSRYPWQPGVMAPQPPGVLSPSQEGADPWTRGSAGTAVTPPPVAEEPPRGVALTEGILGATVVGRILGGPAPSSFGTCDNRTRGSLGAPTPLPRAQPPPHPARCPPRGLPVPPPFPLSPAALTVWAPVGGSVLGPRVCTRFASWIEKEGTVPGGLCPPPPWHAKKGSSPGTHLVLRRGGGGIVTGKERLRVLQLLHARDRLWGHHLAPSPGAKSSPELPARAGTCPPTPCPPPCVHPTRSLLQPLGVRRKALLPSRT